MSETFLSSLPAFCWGSVFAHSFRPDGAREREGAVTTSISKASLHFEAVPSQEAGPSCDGHDQPRLPPEVCEKQCGPIASYRFRNGGTDGLNCDPAQPARSPAGVCASSWRSRMRARALRPLSKRSMNAEADGEKALISSALSNSACQLLRRSGATMWSSKLQPTRSGLRRDQAGDQSGLQLLQG